MEKTLYLLDYVQDEVYWRRFLMQLDRGEGHHVLAHAVFRGKKRELH